MMKMDAVARAWQTVRPHVALIKFRKGGSAIPPSTPQAVQAPVIAAATARPSSTPQKKYTTIQGPVLHDWQLPPRYRRSLLSDQEIACINRGGPE